MISISTLQTSRSWVVIFHLRRPMACFSLNIRYARACSLYEYFNLRARRLSSKLFKQGYLVKRLKSSFRNHQFFRVIKIHSNCNFVGLLHHPFWLYLVMALWVYVFNFLNSFLWLRITDEGLEPEMRIWSISLIKSNLKWCKSFFNFNYLVSVTAGGPGSPWGHMQPSSTVDFSWFVAFWEHQLFRVFKIHSNCNFVGLLHHPLY